MNKTSSRFDNVTRSAIAAGLKNFPGKFIAGYFITLSGADKIAKTQTTSSVPHCQKQ
jgi:hypothetical protein